MLTPEHFSQSASRATASAMSQTQKRESARRASLEKLVLLRQEVVDIEVALGLSQDERWTPSTPEYQETLKYLHLRTYHCALDRLEKLLVQRIFELHKMNASSMGTSLYFIDD
jgi:hypothetical protein